MFGEHAVVYSKPAIAAALSKRTFLAMATNDEGRVSLRLPDLQVPNYFSNLDSACVALLKHNNHYLEIIIYVIKKFRLTYIAN